MGGMERVVNMLPIVEQSIKQHTDEIPKANRQLSEFVADDALPVGVSALHDSNFNLSLSPDILELLTGRNSKDKGTSRLHSEQTSAMNTHKWTQKHVEMRGFQPDNRFNASESPVKSLDRGEDIRVSLRRI